MKQDNPFAKLGALYQKLYQDTVPKPQRQDVPSSGNPDIQNTSIPDNPVLQKPAKREFFTKATYRLCDDALDAIEDAKKTLKRQFVLKVNLEEIVETAVLEAYKDLSEKGEKSALVTKYSSIPENKNS